MAKQKVLFDHDGGVDDLISLIMLLTMKDIEIVGVCVTPADCFLSDATESTLKILKLFGRSDIPVAQGNLHGINPFHYDWRAQPKMCNALPIMLTVEADYSLIHPLPAHEFIENSLHQSEEPISILMTGPCSNLVAALDMNDGLKANIEKVVWMGGAVDVKGNVAIHNHDGSAEWNVFWDPIASAKLVEYQLPLYLVGLDATNCLPIDKEFLTALAQQKDYQVSDLAGQFWACTVASIPSYEFTYFLWDVTTTVCLAEDQQAVFFEQKELAVSINEPDAGKTYAQPGNGQWVNVAMSADKNRVIDFVFGQLRQNFTD